jgi:hypothetical protein
VCLFQHSAANIIMFDSSYQLDNGLYERLERMHGTGLDVVVSHVGQLSVCCVHQQV